MSDNAAIVIVICAFLLCVTTCAVSTDYVNAHKCPSPAKSESAR